MTILHDAAVREEIKRRVQALRADSARKWGAMTVDQMLWHAAAALEACMGRLDLSREKPPPMPKALLRFAVLNLPWPKGAPTMEAARATKRYDLEAERARLLRLIDEFTARPIEGPWPLHAVLGRMSGEQYSRLQARHLDHHLSQFGA
jgi:hypothetical protein